MKRTFQWVSIFTVAASMTALAQQQGASSPSMTSPQSGQTITVQGCLQQGAGSMSTSTSPLGSPSSTGSTASTSTGSTGTAGSTGSTAAAGTQGATAQTGQAAGAGMAGAAAGGAGMFTLRVTEGSGNTRTGMPSATAGQTDERSAAGQQSKAKVYHLVADSSTNLAAHVGHQIEVTGTLSAASGKTGSSGSAGAGSGSTGYTGPGTSGSGSTGAGAAGGATSSTGTTTGSSQPGSSTSAMGPMQHGTHAAAGVLRVTNVKMIATTCQ